jgi:hypothetical protein
MKIQDMFSGNWLKASDLKGDETKTIKEVQIEPVGDKDKPVLYFQDETAMVLNITNANSIKTLHGDETDLWTGKPITIYCDQVPFRGDIVPAIRVRTVEATRPSYDDPAPPEWVSRYEKMALDAQHSLDITSPAIPLGATMGDVKSMADTLQSMIDAIK